MSGRLHGRGRWKKRSTHQLRVEPLCRICLANGQVVPAVVADHIEPHHGEVNSFWLGKLQSLCKRCHDSRKKFVEHRGYDNAIGFDGYPVDSKHPVYQGFTIYKHDSPPS